MKEYATAAVNKIRVAQRHLELLDSIRGGRQDEQVEIQLHFEGLIAAGSSAGDQAAEAFADRLGLRIRNNSPTKLLSELARVSQPMAGLDACLDELDDWASSPIVRDAHSRRRRAVHHHYLKTPDPERGTWILTPLEINGEPSPYDGPLDVHSYALAYVEALDRLDSSVACLRASDDQDRGLNEDA